jgi:hypothetical protein
LGEIEMETGNYINHCYHAWVEEKKKKKIKCVFEKGSESEAWYNLDKCSPEELAEVREKLGLPWVDINERLPKLELCGNGVLQGKSVWLTDGEKIVDGYYYDCTKRTDVDELKSMIPTLAIVTDKGWHCYGMNKSKITHWMLQILPNGKELG